MLQREPEHQKLNRLFLRYKQVRFCILVLIFMTMMVGHILNLLEELPVLKPGEQSSTE